jgi:hypothetical protein
LGKFEISKNCSYIRNCLTLKLRTKMLFLICLILFQMLLYFELVVLVEKKVFQFLCHFVVYLFTDHCCLGNNLCTYSPNCVPLMIYVHCSPYWPLLFIPVQFLCWLQISNFTHSHFILHFLCYYIEDDIKFDINFNASN